MAKREEKRWIKKSTPKAKDILVNDRSAMKKIEISSPSQINNQGQMAVGDTVRIGITMVEGTKERTQFFEGTVLAIKSRQGRKSVRVRKLSQGIGIEKVFVLDSPKIVSVERKKITSVRRAKLYFLRNNLKKLPSIELKR